MQVLQVGAWKVAAHAWLADPPDSQDFTTVPGMLARHASLLPHLMIPRKGMPACLLCLGDFRCVSEKSWPSSRGLQSSPSSIQLQKRHSFPACALTTESPLTCLAGGKSCWHTSPSLLFHLLSEFTQHTLRHPSN